MQFVKSERSYKVTNEQGGPFRLQTPKVTVADYNREYNTMTLECPNELENQWRALEEQASHLDDLLPWHSALSGDRLRVKIEGGTMLFDSKSELVSGGGIRAGSVVTCLLEIKSVYIYKGMSGFTCKVHQIKIHDRGGCLI